MRRLCTPRNVVRLLITGVIVLALYFLLKDQEVKTSLKSVITTFHVWPNVPIVVLTLLTLGLFSGSTLFRNLVGEYREPRNHRPLGMFFVPILMLFALYFLLTFTPESLLPTQQLSIVVISVAFAAFPLAVTAIDGIDVKSRKELIGITQKFVLVVVLFTIFIVVTYMLNQAPFKDLDINHPVWSSINGWVIALSFLIEAFSYFCSIALFILGTYDLVVTFANLRILFEDGKQVVPNLAQSEPNHPHTVNPAISHIYRPAHRKLADKANHSVAIIVWWIFAGGVIISLLLGVLCALKWPDTQVWSLPLAIEIGGLAISFPLIYLLVDSSIKVERRNRWQKVRNTVLNDIRTQNAGMLEQIEFVFSQDLFVMDFASNNDAALCEAKRLSEGSFDHYWVTDQDRLKFVTETLDSSVNSIIWTSSHYSLFLDEEPNLFEKILDVKNKKNKLMALSSYRSVGADGREFMRPEQSIRINEAFKQLLVDGIAVAEEINQL